MGNWAPPRAAALATGSPRHHSQQFKGPLLQLGRTRQHFKQRHFPHLLLDPVAGSVRSPSLASDFFRFTATGEVFRGEALARIPVQVVDQLLADRGYFDPWRVSGA